MGCRERVRSALSTSFDPFAATCRILAVAGGRPPAQAVYGRQAVDQERGEVPPYGRLRLGPCPEGADLPRGGPRREGAHPAYGDQRHPRPP